VQLREAVLASITLEDGGQTICEAAISASAPATLQARASRWHLDGSDCMSDSPMLSLVLKLADGSRFELAELRRQKEVEAAIELPLIAAITAFCALDKRWEEGAALREWLSILTPDDAGLYESSAALYSSLFLFDEEVRILETGLRNLPAGNAGKERIKELLIRAQVRRRRGELLEERYKNDQQGEGLSVAEEIDLRKQTDRSLDIEYLLYCYWRLYRRHPADFDVLRHLAAPTRVSGLSESEAFFQTKIRDLFPETLQGQELTVQSDFRQGRYDRLIRRYSQTDEPFASELIALTVVQALMRQRKSDLFVDYWRILHRLPPSREFWPLRNSLVSFLKKRLQRRFGAPPAHRHKPADTLFSETGGTNVALCISGQLRGFREALPSINEHIVRKYDAKVFISTWSDVGYAEGSHAGRVFRGLPPAFARNLPRHVNSSSFAKHFKDTYALMTQRQSADAEELRRYIPGAAVRIDEQEEFEQLALSKGGKVTNPLKMYYRMHCAFRMLEDYEKEHGKRFDIVFWCRPDLLIRSLALPNVSAIGEELVSPMFGLPGSFLDYFAFGRRHEMKILFGIWEKLVDNVFAHCWPVYHEVGRGAPGVFFQQMFVNGFAVVTVQDVGGSYNFQLVNPKLDSSSFRRSILHDLEQMTGEDALLYRQAAESYLQTPETGEE
jgi:hypothetical protein